jgi:single-strand DNA-binding protein
MAYLNRCEIIGNLGKDAVVVHLQSGSIKVSLSVACSKKNTDRNGEQKEQTNWFNVVVWGKLAEAMERIAPKKGSSVYVAGEMNFRNYTDQDGVARSIAELSAETVQLLTPRNAQPQQQQAPAQNYGSMGPSGNIADDDDLPF